VRVNKMHAATVCEEPSTQPWWSEDRTADGGAELTVLTLYDVSLTTAKLSPRKNRFDLGHAHTRAPRLFTNPPSYALAGRRARPPLPSRNEFMQRKHVM